MPTLARFQPQETTLVDAVADVALAAQQVVVDRAELLHLQVKHDARHYAIAVCLGVAAFGAAGTAFVAGAAALAWALAPAIGVAGALAVVAGVALGLAASLAVVARRVIALPSAQERLALEAGDEIDA
jgi:hypothetical protein